MVSFKQFFSSLLSRSIRRIVAAAAAALFDDDDDRAELRASATYTYNNHRVFKLESIDTWNRVWI